MKTSQTLCEVCSNIHFRPLWDCGFPEEEIKAHFLKRCRWREASREAELSWYYFHHKSKDVLQASANDGCHCCLMIWNVLSGPKHGFAPWGPAAFAAGQVFLFLGDNPNKANEGHSCIKIGVECAELSIEGQFGLTIQNTGRTFGRQDIPRPIICDADTQISVFAAELDKTTTSPANVALAKIWLANCMECHSPCNTRDNCLDLPRRVIDLSDPDAPRLVSGNGITGQYIALSYKWGNSQKCITTSENVEERMQLIPTNSLPRTFREAIELSNRLGFQYLWIDSLCIIQDSEEDKDTEINSMDQVYQNATVTISAAGANDVDSGLAVARDPRETKPCQVNVKLTIHGQTSEVTTLISFYKDHVMPGYFPLFDRGWVLQEQLMSRRSLIFGSRYMSWECLCTRSSEKWPTVTSKVDELPRNLYSSSIDENIYSSLDVIPMMRTSLVHQRKRSDEAFEKWYEMVKNYSMRSLSYPSDVLRALSGLSNVVGRLYNSTYAFGLWLENLAAGLVWFIRKTLAAPNGSPPKAQENSQKGAVFPSWTWAGHWGHCIQFRNTLHRSCYFDYEGTEDTCDGSLDKATKSKTLILRGRLKPAKAGPLLTEWKGEDNWKREDLQERPLWFGSLQDAASGERIGRIIYDENPESANVSEVSCLLCSAGSYSYDYSYLTCVALVPTLKLESEYRRVGLVVLDNENWFGNVDWGGSMALKTSAEVSNYSGIRLV